MMRSDGNDEKAAEFLDQIRRSSFLYCQYRSQSGWKLSLIGFKFLKRADPRYYQYYASNDADIAAVLINIDNIAIRAKWEATSPFANVKFYSLLSSPIKFLHSTPEGKQLKKSMEIRMVSGQTFVFPLSRQRGAS